MIERLASFLGGIGQPGARVLVIPGQARPEEVLRRHRRRHEALAGETRVGSTRHFVYFSDGSPEGDAAARAMAGSAEADYAAIQGWFGGLDPPGLPFTVYADPQAQGAFHMSCEGTHIHVMPDSDRAPGFLAAEVVEVFEAALGNGWDCGRTNGEALSRVLAFATHPTLAADFAASEERWWSAGHPDHVNDNGSGDTDEIANGCGDLFLWYLNGQLGIDWSRISAAGGASLGQAYHALSGFAGEQGFADFVARLNTIATGGRLQLPTGGNPFPIEAAARA